LADTWGRILWCRRLRTMRRCVASGRWHATCPTGVGRCSWACMAKQKQIPIGVIKTNECSQSKSPTFYFGWFVGDKHGKCLLSVVFQVVLPPTWDRHFGCWRYLFTATSIKIKDLLH
jgi:hypothetical protein